MVLLPSNYLVLIGRQRNLDGCFMHRVDFDPRARSGVSAPVVNPLISDSPSGVRVQMKTSDADPDVAVGPNGDCPECV